MSSASHAGKSDSGNRGTPDDRWEPRDARRRRQLIEATIASIAQHGLPGTTVARVAEIAGLSSGIVGFYFNSKKALLLSTLEYVNSEFEQMQQEALAGVGDDPVRQLKAMVQINFDPKVYDRGRVAVWNAFWGEAGTRDDYHRVCGAREAAEERQIVALFEKIEKQGNYSRLDAESLGRGFYYMLTSIIESRPRDRDTPFDFEGATTTCFGFLSSIFPKEFSDDADRVEPAPVSSDAAEVPEFETLPTWVYRNPEFYELEKEYIFQQSWLLAGHASQAPEPGDYFSLEAADERALVIRGRDQRLRAFYNVCRHRASRVVRDERGSCSHAIVCPSHGWAYDFDGKLRAVPAEQTFGTIDKTRLGLPEIELEEWMGFVFIRFGGDGPGVATSLRPFEEELRPFRIEEMKPYGRPYSETHDFNWKLFAENGADEYRSHSDHPARLRALGAPDCDATDSDADAHGAASLLDEKVPAWSQRTYQRLLPELDCVPAEYRREAIHYPIFPGSVLKISPDFVECVQALPVGPRQCQIRGFAVAPADDRREMRAARYLNTRLSRAALAKALDICRWTDAGIRSGSYRGGVLSDLESSVRQFHQKIREHLPVSKWRESPESGRVATLNLEMRRDD
jgi:phenylpropionate dioxygenase-like ring-hydroxylating dioxygenase large terminal subunit/AcrR family transcriptional regulator